MRGPRRDVRLIPYRIDQTASGSLFVLLVAEDSNVPASRSPEQANDGRPLQRAGHLYVATMLLVS